MAKLCAKYRFALDAPLHVRLRAFERSAGTGDADLFGPEDLKFQANLDDFEVVVELQAMVVLNPLVGRHESFGIGRVVVSATREVEEQPSRSDRQAYRNVCYLAINRTLQFFKYKMGNPLIETRQWGHVHESVEWTLDGSAISNRGEGLIFAAFPGASEDHLGSSKLKRSDRQMLTEAIQEGVHFSVIDEMKSHAQASIFRQEIQLAVLQLAMTAEVGIKKTVLKSTEVSEAVFDYLEEKRAIEISPIEIVHGLSKRVFGESFREVNEAAYFGLGDLFRCRNSVAHRLVPEYRDRHGILHAVDQNDLREWWVHVDALLGWLEHLPVEIA